jgi:hypothetical protein
MRDSTDLYIRQALKNWTAEQKPPENLRARILLIAAAAQREQFSPRNPEQPRLDIVIPNKAPLDQAIQLHNLPWFWVTHISLAPVRQVT